MHRSIVGSDWIGLGWGGVGWAVEVELRAWEDFRRRGGTGLFVGAFVSKQVWC